MTEKTEDVKPEDEAKSTDSPPDKAAEKTFAQSEVNALMAKERKAYETKLKTVSDEFASFKKQIDDAREAQEAAAKEKVEKLREGLPDGIINLLDKLAPLDQLEWLSDPANTITKQTIHKLPEPREGEKRAPSIGTIV